MTPHERLMARECVYRAELLAVRAHAEGNEYALERAAEADGCAAAIRQRAETL